jgi:signal transduction histidine kinase
VGDIRRLVHGLRPPALDELGLVGALRQRALQYGSGGLRQSVDGANPGESALIVTVDAPDDLGALPAAVEVAAYRVADEALANVARHAAATTCTVRLTVAADALVLAVDDDGQGLPPDRTAGVGLVSMRERAEELGGSLELATGSSGHGLRLIARLPLATPNPGNQ